ncbi:helix-turn-helix transcriptional regulator [Stutzerimonas balearica]|uniref:AraC family transcriptional regulator n=1 Tax=Stutzerimonas balearica DSM 6083 TaxID=1123016 RepID=A0A8D3Y0Z2_9GAMM|nr:AraC family transcriptional regulator [Stutzerimonas balearica]AJE14881.1 AraC family transcriptional regulator [Stutzerimonas balearica DSM 6083]SDM33947.1 transcriptional regulator, AraC family [Stutzerimonas balearica DSM 6083]
MDSLLKLKSRIFDHADPHAVSDYVNEHVGPHCIRLSAKTRPEASLSHRKFGRIDLCQISYGGRVQVTSPALENLYHLQVLQRCHCLWRGGRGQEHVFTPGELLLINPDDVVDLTYSDDCEKLIVKLPAAFLEQACLENRWKAPREGIRFAESRYRLEQIDGFDSLLGLVCHEAESASSVGLVQEQYSRIIASKLLCLLTNNVSREGLESCPTFGRLVDYIEEHIKQDITVEQLAELAHMSPRSLYVLFERKAGTTPKSFIRQRKLERVRCSLSDPEGGVRNVTEVAMDYGFLHLGRFSESYRNAFGELPSDTLRRTH